MPTTDIKCIYGCNTVLGTSNLDPYPGDAHFGMACAVCTSLLEDKFFILVGQPGPTFDPASPSTVRVQVRTLRGELSQYNNASKVKVAIDEIGTTAPNAKLNDGAVPVEVTMTAGVSPEVAVTVTGEGLVVLKLQDQSAHPKNLTLDANARLTLEFKTPA